MEAQDAMVTSPVERGNSRVLMIVAGVIVALALAVWAWRQTAGGGAPEDISGVWRSAASGEVYVFAKEGEDYRLTVAGRRLPVTEVAKAGDQLLLTVRTDSFLKAVWSLSETKSATGGRQLRLDKDGFAAEDLGFQRALTSADLQRIARLRAAKKPLWSPSYDCSKAASEPERLICSDAGLAQLDVSLARRYKEVSDDPVQREAQSTWLRDVRNVCTDSVCMREAYQSRMTVLEEAALDGEGDYDAGYADEAAAPAADATAAPAADAAPANY